MTAKPPALRPASGPAPLRSYAAPPPPVEGQHFASPGVFWVVKRVTLADDPVGFYLVTLCHGPTLESLHESMVLGPHEFAKLVRERRLRPHP